MDYITEGQNLSSLRLANDNDDVANRPTKRDFSTSGTYYRIERITLCNDELDLGLARILSFSDETRAVPNKRKQTAFARLSSSSLNSAG